MFAAIFALTACSSPPLAEETASVGDGVVVQLLDAAFVRVGGRRMPWEALVYDMRVRCRAGREHGHPPPRIDLVVPVDVDVPAATVDRIQAELRAAGVRRIEMRLAGS